MKVKATPDAVPEEILNDLRVRLASTRLVALSDAAGWSLGTERGYLTDLLSTWRETYDWRDVEEWLQALPRVVVGSDDRPVRLVHQRAANPDAPVVVLLHGWPDSVMRFRRVLPLLKDVHVVVPALPGFPFAVPTSRNVLSASDFAAAISEAVADLGYDHYVLSGGDVGTDVTEAWAAARPESVAAVHLTDVSHRHALVDPPDDLSSKGGSYLDALHQWHAKEGAYNHLQSTCPDTLAIGLGDSPAGLAAWIVEKLHAWSDCHGDLESVFRRRDVLDWVTAYWLSGSIGTSFAPYAHRSSPGPVEVPAAFTMFPGDIVKAPRSWAARFFDVRSWTTAAAGGHFDAWERPEDYVNGIRAAISSRVPAGPLIDATCLFVEVASQRWVNADDEDVVVEHEDGEGRGR